MSSRLHEKKVMRIYNLLIVDDELLTRNGIMNVLQQSNLELDRIEQADDGITALEAVTRFQPDILLTDVRMPFMNGMDLAAKLQESYPDCKIIFMSGFSDKQYLKTAIRLKAVHYIDKPIYRAELVEILQEAIQLCKQDRLMKQKAQLADKVIDMSLPILRGDIALRLLQPGFEPHAHEWIATGLVDADAVCGGIVGIIQIENVPDKVESAFQQTKERLKAAVEERFAHSGFSQLAGYKNDNFLIVHAFNRQGKAVSEALAEAVLLEACAAVGLERYFIALGERVDKLANVPHSYTTAVVALQRAFFHGYGKAYRFAPDPAPELGDGWEPGYGKYKAALEDKNLHNALHYLNGLIADLKRHDGTNINTVKTILYEWVLALFRQAELSGIRSDDFTEEKSKLFWEKLWACRTLQEAEQLLSALVHALFEDGRRLEQTKISLSRIYQYIHEHYGDAEMSVKQIAHFAFLSPAYMCTYFKSETGKTINQYMTEYRLDKAKGYLAEKTYRISEIANLVGYSDSNYFAKIFRKQFGIAPTDYRERVMQT